MNKVAGDNGRAASPTSLAVNVDARSSVPVVHYEVDAGRDVSLGRGRREVGRAEYQLCYAALCPFLRYNNNNIIYLYIQKTSEK